jgi:antitoxin component of MazEF toxin-antitoxin module
MPYNYSPVEPEAVEVECKMQKTTSEAKRVGGSLMVRIPAELAKEEGIEEGDMVEIQVKKARKSWFASMPDLAPMTREDELDAHG